MAPVFIRRFIGCLILAILLPGAGGATRAQPNPALSPVHRRSVLVLHATRRGGVSQQVGDPIFRRILTDGLDAPVDYYAETLDLLLIKNPAYRDAVRQFLRAKYQGQAFDVLVAVGDESLSFLSTLREDLAAGGTPLVFAVPTQPARPVPNSTGLITTPHFTETIEGALALHPGTELVTVITGASPLDRAYEAEARAEFAPLERRVAIRYLSALPVAEVLRQVAQTPRHGILFLTSLAEDSDGEAFPPLDIAERLSRAANAPLYSWINLYVGHGVVGGRMDSPEVQATRTAELALRVLKGERPDTIAISRVDWTTTQFDWAQLHRWNIDEARLPAGSQVLFRPPSPWDQYAGVIAGVGAIGLLQAVFIVALLVQRAGRRRAETALRESEARFRLLADTTPMLIWRAGIDKGCEFVNRSWLEFTGRTAAQELGRGWLESVHPDDVAGCIEAYGSAFDARRAFRMECRLRRADGVYRWIMTAGVPLYEDRDRYAGYIGSSVDVNDYREAMERLSESQRQQERLAGRLIDARESESTRIARELHDNINQQLAGLAIALSSLRRRSDTSSPDSAMTADIRVLQERTAAIVEDVRHISRGLHPGVLEHTGLVMALAAHCRELGSATGLAVSFGADGDFDGLDSAASLCLFRVAQESLRNVVAHAAATKVTVTLVSISGCAELCVVDNGNGFDETGVRRAGQGLGLVSMQERARLAGGNVQVATAVGRGTTVRVRIPVTIHRDRVTDSTAVIPG